MLEEKLETIEKSSNLVEIEEVVDYLVGLPENIQDYKAIFESLDRFFERENIEINSKLKVKMTKLLERSKTVIDSTLETKKENNFPCTEIVQQLEAISDSTEFDTLLDTINKESERFSKIPEVLKSIIAQMNSTKIELNSKIKRKAKRLLERLENPGSKPPSAVTQNDPNTNSIIQRLNSVGNPSALDLILTELSDSAITGNETKEPLSTALQSAIDKLSAAGTANAKLRRKVSRLVSSLQVGSSAPKDENRSRLSLPVPQPEEKRKPDNSSQAPPAKRKKAEPPVPFIAFVGNLSYSTTKEDIVQHLRTLEGFGEQDEWGKGLKVRLLTDPATKNSRGIAFVETNGADALRHCISRLHRSVLQGRTLNVEKSCGGRNRSRREERIASQREVQKHEVRGQSEKILREYCEKGVIKDQAIGENLRHVLMHSCNPIELEQALKRYSALPPDSRRLADLHKMATSYQFSRN